MTKRASILIVDTCQYFWILAHLMCFGQDFSQMKFHCWVGLPSTEWATDRLSICLFSKPFRSKTQTSWKKAFITGCFITLAIRAPIFVSPNYSNLIADYLSAVYLYPKRCNAIQKFVCMYMKYIPNRSSAQAHG